MNKNVFFQDLGMIDYKKAWEYQEKLFAKTLSVKSNNRVASSPSATDNYLLFCEHPHVYTLGKSGDKKNLLVTSQYLKNTSIDFYQINRGGDITYHGPGQITGYPILDLENFFTDINKYLRLLEEAIILTLKDYNIVGIRSKGETGVWIDQKKTISKKICALGVRSSRWITMHGFAFNINSDLSYFENIIPCGILHKSVTSLEKEIGAPVDLNDVKKKLKIHLSSVFEMNLLPL